MGTPLPIDADLLSAHFNQEILNGDERKKYRSITENLLHLEVYIRPEISFSVSVSARKFHALIMLGIQSPNHILHYIAAMVHHSPKYPSSVDMSPWSLEAHVDAD